MEPLRIISMELSTGGRVENYFRILAGTNVKYITIQAGALDDDSLLDMPLDFHNILPPLPYDKDNWNQAYISRNAASGKLEPTLSKTELPGVQTIWHSETVNFLDLERTKQLTLLAQESIWKQEQNSTEGSPGSESQTKRTIISKMARFHWEVQYIEAETRIYQRLQPLGIGPKFLGHVHEAGRVMGFILEKVDGRHAGWEDLEVCQAALRRLHGLGIAHGDCNRYNFIIGPDDNVTLIDFEKAIVNADLEMMEREISGLEEQLREETGRGGGFILEESD